MAFLRIEDRLGDEIGQLPIDAGVTAVGKEVGLLWDLFAPLGDTTQLVWDDRAALGDTTALQWDIFTAVNDQFQALWDIRAAVGDELQALWDLAFALGDSNQLVWNTRAAVGDQFQALWDIFTAVNNQFQALWDIRVHLRLSNTFEGGSNGTAITPANSGGASGDPFDAVTLVGGGAVVFDDFAGIADGTFSARFSSDVATSQLAYVTWDSSWQEETEVWTRMYYRVDNVTPFQGHMIGRLALGASERPHLNISSTGHLLLTDVTFTTRYTSSLALVANTVYRIEWHVVHSATVGHMEARIFYGTNLHGTTPDETFGNLTDNWNTGASSDTVQFGRINTAQTVLSEWFDAIAIDNSDWIGPVADGLFAIGNALSLLWDNLIVVPYEAFPTYVGSGGFNNGAGTIVLALPGGLAVDDILLALVETANQASTVSNSAGGTWTEVPDSPQGIGTGGAANAVRLTVFWSRYNGTQTAPTMSDSGDHNTGVMLAFRGCIATGDPFDVTAGTAASANATATLPGDTTTVGRTMIVAAVATDYDTAQTDTFFSNWANADLTSITQRVDRTYAGAQGGGIGVATGLKQTAGAFGNTTVTQLASEEYAGIVLALKPIPSKQLQLKWDINAIIGDQFQALWDIRQAVGDQFEALWDVLAATAVGDEISLLWDIRTVIGDQIQALWDQYSLVGDTSTIQWDINAAISNTVALLWDLRYAQEDTLTLQWDIYEAVGKAFQALWDLRAAIGDQTDLRWDDLAAVGDSISLQWDLRLALADTLEALWDIYTSTSDEVTLRWDLNAPVGAQIQLLWDLAFALADDNTLRWDVHTNISDTISLLWDILRNYIYLRPVATVENNGWETAPTPGGNLWANIDEASPDDDDYIWVET